MRIQCQYDVVAGIVSDLARLLLSYYFISYVATPLVLSLICAALGLILFGIKICLAKEQFKFDRICYELSIYKGCDLLVFFVTISKVDPTSYALVQLLVITGYNAFQHQMLNKKILWLSFVGSVLFLRANKAISLLDVTCGAISSTFRLESRQMTLRHSKAINMQAGLISDTALCIMLWLTTSFERAAFMNAVSDLKTLVCTGVVASLAFIWNTSSISTTRQSTIVTASLIYGVIFAMLTTSGIQLLLTLLAVVMVAFAAHNRTLEEDLLDQHYNDIITPRVIQHHDKFTNQKLTGVIVLTMLLFLAHLESQNLTANEMDTFKPIEIKPSNKIPSVDFNDRSMPVGVRHQLRRQCLHKTRALYIDRVGAMIKPNKNFAVIHFPDHWNLGDAFIYNGQTVMWHVYGQLFQRGSVKDEKSIFTQILSGQIDVKGGVIFMTGGGNVGDTYPEADINRWQLISAIGRDNIFNCTMVMLPQSIHYKSRDRLDLAVKGYNHPNLTMMLRDTESLKIAQEKFKANSMYVPDAAFMLGPLLPNADPVVDLFFLIRQDFESAIQNKQSAMGLAAKLKLTAEVWDFPILGFPESKIGDKVISNITRIFPGRYLYDGRDQSVEAMVAYRTQLGNSMMSRGHVIITDRLHASIMATLIDRPVVYIDNNYRKTSRVRSALSEHVPECTDAVLNAHYAPNIEAAVEIAEKIIFQLRNQL